MDNFDHQEIQSSKRIKIVRLNDFLKEKETLIPDQSTTLVDENGKSFNINFSDSCERARLINLIKIEREIKQNSFDKTFIEIPTSIKQPRFHLVVKNMKESFERRIQDFLKTKLNYNSTNQFDMIVSVKKNDVDVHYVRFPQIVCKSYDDLSVIVDEFASLFAIEVDQYIYEIGMPLPISEIIWSKSNLTSIEELFVNSDGTEQFMLIAADKKIRETQSASFLPNYVIPVFEMMYKNTKVTVLRKGRSENIWLIKCGSDTLNGTNGIAVCQQGMAHFKEWFGAISWQNTKQKLNYQCWGCPEKKWNSIGHLVYNEMNQQINVKKTRSRKDETEDELNFIFNVVKLNDQGIIVVEQPINNTINQLNPLNPLIESQLLTWKKLNENTQFNKRGRTDNTYEYDLKGNSCVIDGEQHSDNQSKFLVSWIKNTGRIRFKCLSGDCGNYSKWVNIGFIHLDQTMTRITKEILNTTPTPTTTATTENSYDTDTPFDYLLLVKLAITTPVKAFEYINKYCAKVHSNLSIWCRTNHKLEWKPTTSESLEKTYSGALTPEGKNIFRAWGLWPYMRLANEVTFIPQKINDPKIINIYRGFSVKPSNLPKEELQSIIQPWENHIFEIIANGDVVLGNYIINFFARIFQKPWEKGIISLVIKSEHGAGKNVIFNSMSKIFDRYYLLLRNVDSAFSKFTGRFEKAILVVFDEAKCQNKQAISSIKSFIAAPKVEIEKKFLDPDFVDNFTNFVFLSNEDWVLDIESTERRFILVEANNKYAGKQDRETKRYMDSIKDVPPENLLQYFLERDLSNFDVVCDAPLTDYTIDQKIKSLRSASDRWLYQLLSEPKNQPQSQWFDNRILTNTVKYHFSEWSRSCDGQSEKSTLQLWKQLEKYKITKIHTFKNGNQGYYLNFPDLETLQKTFAFVCFKLKNHKMLFP